MEFCRDDGGCGGKRTANGIKKDVKENMLSHDIYVQTLLETVVQMHTVNSIRSFQHDIYTVSQTRRTLSPYDDKRYILNDGICSFAYGHYMLKALAVFT